MRQKGAIGGLLTSSSGLVRLLDVGLRMMLLGIMIIDVLDVRGDGERVTAELATVQLDMRWVEI